MDRSQINRNTDLTYIMTTYTHTYLEGSVPAILTALSWCGWPTTMNMHCLQLSATSFLISLILQRPKPCNAFLFSASLHQKPHVNTNHLLSRGVFQEEKARGFEESKRKNEKKTQSLRKNVRNRGMCHQLSNFRIMEGSKLRSEYFVKAFLLKKKNF